MKALKMPNLNHVIVSGRTTKDGELNYSNNGTAILTLSIAYNRNYQKDGEWQQEVSFFRITTFGNQAENHANIAKGSPVLVEGSLKQDTWQDKDGNKRSAVNIIAFRILELEREFDITQAEWQETPKQPESDDVPF